MSTPSKLKEFYDREHGRPHVTLNDVIDTLPNPGMPTEDDDLSTYEALNLAPEPLPAETVA